MPKYKPSELFPGIGQDWYQLTLELDSHDDCMSVIAQLRTDKRDYKTVRATNGKWAVFIPMEDHNQNFRDTYLNAGYNKCQMVRDSIGRLRHR